MARIQIWTRDVSGFESLHPTKRPQHTFLIKINDDGTREILRGGPVYNNMFIDDIEIVRQEYNDVVQSDNITPTYDYYDPSSNSNPLNYQGQTIKTTSQSEIDSLWNAAWSAAQNVNAQNYDYEAFTQNCNTTTALLAETMGLKNEVSTFLSGIGVETLGFDYGFNTSIHDKIIVGITKSGNGEYIDASGIKDGKLFDTKDKNFLRQILDSKSYVKFYSFFDEGSGNYQEFYIPIKNYNLIKDHLLVLDKDSRKMTKGKVSNFAISFSAMLHLISPEVIGKVRPMENKQFPWIEEISSTPYYSTIHPLSHFVAKDNVINDPLLMMGYGYPSRMFKSNVLLARILQETNILPKNFSIIPIIEKSLRSGNREYCGTISNPQGLLIVEKLHGKDFKVSKTYMKCCFGKNQIKIPSKSKYSSANNDGVKNINL